MTVKLGLFTMPMHDPERDYATILTEDQEAIVLADRLGFTEAFVGEHFSSWSERITSPLIFFATPIPRTTQIVFGTGVMNLPQMHIYDPATGRLDMHALRPIGRLAGNVYSPIHEIFEMKRPVDNYRG